MWSDHATLDWTWARTSRRARSAAARPAAQPHPLLRKARTRSAWGHCVNGGVYPLCLAPEKRHPCKEPFLLLGHVDESAVVALECDGDRRSRSIPVLRDDEVRLAGARRFLLVCVFSMYKYYHVRILFYSARFA
jgi:hypothetical protein